MQVILRAHFINFLDRTARLGAFGRRAPQAWPNDLGRAPFLASLFTLLPNQCFGLLKR